MGLVPERGQEPVPERAPGQEREPEPVQVSVVVLEQEREREQGQEPELVLVSAGLAPVLSRKREAKCAARCRPGSDWQCC